MKRKQILFLNDNQMFAAALSGFALNLSLILVIGAQNSFVIRQGLLNQHVLAVVLFCGIADMALIFIGALGLVN